MTMVRVCTLLMWLAVPVLSLPAGVSAEDMTFKVESNLRAAVAKVDITPPPGTPISGHAREYDGVRTRLHALVLLLDDGKTKAALVAHDLSSSSDAVTDAFRSAVSDATGIPRPNIMVAAAHNHSGSRLEANPDWSRRVVQDVTAATAAAAKELRPVSVGYGEDRIDFAINRRKVIDGRAVVRLNPNGPCDNRAKVLRFDDGQSLDPLALLMHCVCHPCVHTWGDKFTPPYPNGYPKMSADFPGEAKDFVEGSHGSVRARIRAYGSSNHGFAALTYNRTPYTPVA
jgi:hypothetical protein